MLSRGRDGGVVVGVRFGVGVGVGVSGHHPTGCQIGVFFVQSDFLPLAHFDDPVRYPAPFVEAVDLFAHQIALQQGEAGLVAVPASLVVLAAVVDPDAFGDLARAQLVSTEDVRDDFAQGRAGFARNAVGTGWAFGVDGVVGVRGGR